MSSLISVFSDNQFKPMASEAYVNSKIQEAISSSELPSFHGYTDKPFNFAGKTVYFFGDSICKGYTKGGVTQNNYVKFFGDKTGCTAVNKGVSSSCFSYTHNGVPSIVDVIKGNTLTNVDVIIIEGGINDWQTNATATQLETALDDLSTWLSSNYTGKVVIITPINTTLSRPVNMTVPQVRKIMARWAIQHGYSLILGEQFNFPSETGALSEILLADGLHPTEAGYELFAKNLTYNLVGSEGIPMCPTSTDGTYTLQCTVSSGVPTYSWVAQS